MDSPLLARSLIFARERWRLCCEAMLLTVVMPAFGVCGESDDGGEESDDVEMAAKLAAVSSIHRTRCRTDCEYGLIREELVKTCEEVVKYGLIRTCECEELECEDDPKDPLLLLLPKDPLLLLPKEPLLLPCATCMHFVRLVV